MCKRLLSTLCSIARGLPWEKNLALQNNEKTTSQNTFVCIRLIFFSLQFQGHKRMDKMQLKAITASQIKRHPGIASILSLK